MRDRRGRDNEKELGRKIRYKVNQIIKTERLERKGLDKGSVKWKGKLWSTKKEKGEEERTVKVKEGEE